MRRKILLAIGVLLALLLVAAAGLFAYVQTGPGQRQLAAFLARTLSTPDQRVELEGLRGFVPFDVRLDRLRVSDAEGTWLEVADARLAWAAAPLLRGALRVREAGAARVTLHRLPAGPPPPPSDEPFALPELPELPRSLPLAEIERLHVDAIELGAPVLGEPAVFRLKGRAGTGPDGRAARLGLALERLDQPTGSADLAATLDLPTQNLDLSLKARETGGLLAALTGRPEAGELRLVLAGKGPLSGWDGRLDLVAAGLAAARLDLALAYAAERRLAVEGGVDLAPGLLPAELEPAVGRRVELALAARETAPQRFAVERLEVRAAAATLAGTAAADLAADTITADFSLDAPELARFATAAGAELSGRAGLRLRAEGPVDRPELRLDLDAAVAAAGASVARLVAEAEVTPLAPLGQGAPAARLRARAEADGLTWQGQPLTPDGRATLDLAATVPPEGRAEIERLALRSPLLELDGSGTIDRATLAGSARLDLTLPDLAVVSRTLAPDAPADGIVGSLRLGADLTIAEQARRAEAVIDGGADLRLPPELEALVGATPALSARVAVEPGRSVTVDELDLVGDGFRLGGETRLGLEDQALGGSLRLALPDLGALQPLLGQPVAGALEATLALSGTVPAPDLRLDATARELAVAGQAFRRATLLATAAGEPASLVGELRLAAERAGQTLALATAYRRDGQTLTLDGLTLEGPGTRLAGGLEVALDGPRATGGVAGEVRDLGALAPWHGQDLRGAASLDLRLSAPDGRQDAQVELRASRLAGGFGRLPSAHLEASLADALGAPALDARLALRGLATPSLTLSEATLAARGPLADLAVELAAAGEQAGRRLRLRSAATVDAASATKTVRLTALDGSLAGEPIRLLAPATLSLGPRSAVDRLAMRLGAGELVLAGELGEGRVRAEATADGFPLALAESFGGPALRGTASARANLEGSTQAPEARLEVSLRDLALDPALRPQPDLEVEARLAGGRLDARLSLRELGRAPVVATAAAPLRLSLEPFAATLAPDAPLRGSVEGQMDLSRVARVLALQGVQLAGSLTLDLGVEGTVAEPALAGTLGLANGVVQEVTTGINLRGVELSAVGRGRTLAIERLVGSDRTGGTLSASGTVGLAPAGGATYALAAEATRLRVLDNALGTVVLSGTADLAGDAQAAALTARLRVDGADIAIPEGGGPDVPVIKVREVGTGLRAGPEGSEPADGTPFVLRLDVVVDAPARLFVRGRGLDSEWGGRLTVTGLASEPEIVGSLEFRRGFLDLLDKRFTIRRGTITFVGNDPPLPMIDLEASARSEEIEAVIQLQGPAADPEITLTSEPVLPQDEILSRLLFGSSVSRLSPMQGLRLAAAVNTLRGGGGLSGLLSSLRRGLGVDTLDIQSGETPAESTARAGKYLSDNVYVEVERGVAEGTGKARVKIELTPNLSVGTEVDEQSQTGVGLEWRYDY